MPLHKLADGVYEVGALDPERELFDSFMPTPMGTTYNSYIVRGEDKVALIDPVEQPFVDELFEHLDELGVDRIDYLISLHTEQDHAGSIWDILEAYPEAEVVATQQVQKLLETHLHFPKDKVMVMKDGDTLDLGGRTLRFHPIPFSHWPDNTTVYLEEEKILFSSDLFGTHYAKPGDNSANSLEQQEGLRSYYAEIMMPYRKQCARHVAWTRELAPRYIAPAHGPVWFNPEHVLQPYEAWTGDKVRRKVIIGYVSMHNSTRMMVEIFARRLALHGVDVITRDIAAHADSLTVETGVLVNESVDAAALVIAAPTVLIGPHPSAVYLAGVMNALKPKVRYQMFMGSYGWSSKAADTIVALTGDLKAERLDHLEVEGLPTEEDIERIHKRADELAEKILSIPEEDILA